MRIAPGLSLLLASALLAPTSAIAGVPAPAANSSERRLTPEQIQQVLDEAARKREGNGGPAEPSTTESEAARVPVHGEVGFSIGTGGYRSAFGTAVIGLTGEGTAVLSVGSQRLPGDHYYPYR